MSMAGIRRAGERSVLLDVRCPPAAVAAGIHRLADAERLTLAEVVPGAETVLVMAASPTELGRLLAALPKLEIADQAGDPDAGTVELRVRYDGPDLHAVADALGMDVAEVVRRHCAVTYQASFTGFAPGFAYLSGLDPRLVLPRRDSPRPAVPAGSVAIADAYTAVYPRASPGGWHLLGTTDAAIFDPDREPPALIAPGCRVQLLLEGGPAR
jgi:KipI family sensor histidine kinase inhibitor